MPRGNRTRRAGTVGRGNATHAEAVIIEDLGRRFAAFRRNHRRFTRVPPELRSAFIAALKQGVSPGPLGRACGVSSSQLELWRSAPEPGAVRPPGADQPARVFSVIDDCASRPNGAVGATEGDELELRIGPWAVRVRLAEPQQAGRG